MGWHLLPLPFSAAAIQPEATTSPRVPTSGLPQLESGDPTIQIWAGRLRSDDWFMGQIFPPLLPGRLYFCAVYIQFVTFEWKSDVICRKRRLSKFALLLKWQKFQNVKILVRLGWKVTYGVVAFTLRLHKNQTCLTYWIFVHFFAGNLISAWKTF